MSKVQIELPFPPKDLEAFDFVNQAKASRWSETQIDYVRDANDFENLPDDQKHMLKLIIAFFLLGDQGVNENLQTRFIMEGESREERSFFFEQHCIEDVHSSVYALFALEFFGSVKAVEDFVQETIVQDLVKQKYDFMQKWQHADAPKYQRYTAWACVERMYFLTLFAPIFWFRSRGLLKSFIYANELISFDEILHGDFDALLVRRQLAKMSSEEAKEARKIIAQIIKDALEIEKKFCEVILPNPIEDLNSGDLQKYAALMADRLAKLLTIDERFGGEQVYLWVQVLDHLKVNSFFDMRGSAYSHFDPAMLRNWENLIAKPKEDVLKHPENIDF